MIISLEIALAPGEPCYQPSPGEEVEVRLTDLNWVPASWVPRWYRVRFTGASVGAIFVEPLEPLSSRTLVCSVTGIRPIASPEPAAEIL